MATAKKAATKALATKTAPRPRKAPDRTVTIPPAVDDELGTFTATRHYADDDPTGTAVDGFVLTATVALLALTIAYVMQRTRYGWALFAIHDDDIMRDFCWSIERPDVQDALLDAIQGRGSFRRFRSLVGRHHLEESWHRFRQQALAAIAVEWLEDNGLEYHRDL